jgi:Xaa-Pro aminopeptidase
VVGEATEEGRQIVADTKQAMDAAIDVLQVFGNNVGDLEDESIRTLREVAEGQNFMTSLGIADYISQGVRRSIALTEWDPDDD